MAKMCRVVAGFVLGLSIFPAHAQQFVVDLGLRLELQPPPPYVVGQQFRLRYTIENRSTVFGAFGLIEFIAPIPPNEPIRDRIVPLEITVCDIDDGPFNFIETPFLPRNSITVCEEVFRAVVSTGTPVRLRGRIFNAGVGGFDPNPSNDEDQVELSVLPAPQPRPVPFSPLTYVGMALLLLTAGSWAARR
jgi:hypothetical protein